MKHPTQPILFYCDVPARNLNQVEQETVVRWLMEHWDLDHSDACGFLEASFAVVFTPDERCQLRLRDNHIVLVNDSHILRLVTQEDGTLKLYEASEPV